MQCARHAMARILKSAKVRGLSRGLSAVLPSKRAREREREREREGEGEVEERERETERLTHVE